MAVGKPPVVMPLCLRLSAASGVALLLQAASSDPLEQFCDDNPDADECR
jgi:hypothetical protein